MGRYYEEFLMGEVVETPARTVTEADVVNFAGLSGDFNPLHTDSKFAATTQFGQRIAHGLLGLAFVSGLLGRLNLFDGTALAFVELRWKFLRPVYFGDTLRARQTVVERRETRSPKSGMVTFQVDLVNQHEEIVQSGQRVLMIARRASKPASET